MAFEGWGYYNEITADKTYVADDQSNMVLYYNLATFLTTYFADVKDGGGDLIVTNFDGSVQYPLHVVSCDTSAKTGQIWFKAPISSSADTVYRLYYGNSGASQPGVSDTYGQYNVYTDFTAVYHFEETPDNTPNQIKNAASDNYHGQSVATPISVTGKLGKGIQFDGSQYIDITYSNLVNLSSGTICLWFKSTNASSANEFIFGHRTSGFNDRVYIYKASDDILKYGFFNNSLAISSGVDVKNDGLYHSSCISWDSSTAYGYIDGLNKGSFSGTLVDQNPVINIASALNDPSTFGFEGIIDHITVSSTHITDNLYTSTYNNQSNNLSFFTLGPQEENGAGLSAPQNPSVSAGYEKNTISWDSVAGATSYNIYWSNSSPVTTGDNKISDVSSGYEHTSLTNGQIYYYAIEAENETEASDLSDEVNGTPLIAAPTGVNCTPGDGKNTLSWNSVDGATTYNIYWSLTSPVTTGDNEISDVSSGYEDTGLTTGQIYYYAIEASDGVDDSELSSEVNGTPLTSNLESVIYNTLKNTSAVTDLVSSFNSGPCIFADFAPQEAQGRYIVFDVQKLASESYVIDRFNIDVDIYQDSGDGNVDLRELTMQIEFALDLLVTDSLNYTTIRFYRDSEGFVEKSDIRKIHYNMQFEARACRKRWIDQL